MKALIDQRIALKRELATQPQITPAIQKCMDELPGLKVVVQTLNEQVNMLQAQQDQIVKDIATEQSGVVQVQAQLAGQQSELQ